MGNAVGAGFRGGFVVSRAAGQGSPGRRGFLEELRGVLLPLNNPDSYCSRLYHVSLTLLFNRGNETEKRGIRAGNKCGSPAGIGEVMFSRVMRGVFSRR